MWTHLSGRPADASGGRNTYSCVMFTPLVRPSTLDRRSSAPQRRRGGGWSPTPAKWRGPFSRGRGLRSLRPLGQMSITFRVEHVVWSNKKGDHLVALALRRYPRIVTAETSERGSDSTPNHVHASAPGCSAPRRRRGDMWRASSLVADYAGRFIRLQVPTCADGGLHLQSRCQTPVVHIDDCRRMQELPQSARDEHHGWTCTIGV